MAIALVLLGILATDVRAADRILVLSAASAAPALTQVAADYTQNTGIDVRISSGSSGTLARQILRGAPADIYVSASVSWVEELTNDGLLNRRLTRPLLRNRLVLVSPLGQSTGSMMDLSKPTSVLERLNGGRLAIGDPAHVPAGQYAKQALQSAGLWTALEDRLARQINVRAVLAFVEREESPIGIVYATDLALSSGVQIAAVVPAHMHDPIVYSTAVVSGRERPEVIQFFQTFAREKTRDKFAEFGFGLVEESSIGQSSSIAPSNR